MPENDVNDLVAKSITAQNSTTHAVRAFVRFLFIQLSFYTAAFMVWQIGLLFIDPNENCNIFGCTPSGFFYFVTAVLIILGIWIASRAVWHELELSQVPKAPLWPEGTAMEKISDVCIDEKEKAVQKAKEKNQ
jgi:hypothetical protein